MDAPLRSDAHLRTGAVPARYLGVCLGLLLLLGNAPGAAAPGYPAFTGQSILAGSDGARRFPQTAAMLQAMDAVSQQQYWVVVVASSGAGLFATRDYTDELYRQWVERDARARASVDPDRHVLIVLAEQNRQLSVHAGAYLQNTLGFSGRVIDEEVVRRAFIPHARAGSYDRGLSALIPAIERWIAARERELRIREQQRIREENQARNETRSRLAILRGNADALERQLNVAARQGLAAGALESRLKELDGRMEEAQSLLAGTPAAAARKVGEGEALYRELRTAADALPARRTLLAEQRNQTRALLVAAAAALTGPETRPLSTADLQERLGTAHTLLQRGEDAFKTDYDTAEQRFGEAAAEVGQIQATLRDRARRHAEVRREEQFRTRVLPLLGLGLLAVACLCWLIGRYADHSRLNRQVRTRLHELLSGVAELLDELEALTERHRLLLGTDPDFTAPIAGKTLELYETNEGEVKKAWDLWTALAQARERIQRLIRTESPLGTSRLKQAAEQLPALENTTPLRTTLAEVAGRLERLNVAHEVVREQLAHLAEERGQIRDALLGLRREQRDTSPYHAPVEELDRLIGEIEDASIPDPLTAGELITAAREAAGHLLAWIGRVQELWVAHRRVGEEREKFLRKLTARRTEGWLFTEPGSSPDGLVILSGEGLEQAAGSLTRGDDSGAQGRLEEVTSLLERANKLVDAQIAARAFCETELGRRREETQRLRERVEEVRHADRALREEFARTCWDGLGSVTEDAARRLATFEAEATRAQDLASFPVQHYLAAREALEALARAQGETDCALRTVEERLAALRALREQAQDQFLEAERTRRALEARVQEHRQAVRRPAREALAQAMHALQEVRDAGAVTPPDWEKAARATAAALTRASEGLTALEADVAAWQFAADRAQEAERGLKEAWEFIHREKADRPVCAHRLDAAQKLLMEVHAGLGQTGSQWEQLAALAQRVEVEAKAALELAREDVRLSERAAGEIAEAEKCLRGSTVYYGHGVRADLGDAQAALNEARRLLGNRKYEDALQLAAEAVTAVVTAHELARSQAERIAADLARRTAEEEARRREHHSSAWNSSAWGSSASASTSPSSFDSGSSPSSFDSGSSSSSFDSGTSQSSW